MSFGINWLCGDSRVKLDGYNSFDSASSRRFDISLSVKSAAETQQKRQRNSNYDVFLTNPIASFYLFLMALFSLFSSMDIRLCTAFTERVTHVAEG